MYPGGIKPHALLLRLVSEAGYAQHILELEEFESFPYWLHSSGATAFLGSLSLFNGSKRPFPTLNYKMSSLPQGPRNVPRMLESESENIWCPSSPEAGTRRVPYNPPPHTHTRTVSHHHIHPLKMGVCQCIECLHQEDGFPVASQYTAKHMFLGKALFPRQYIIIPDKR